MKLNELATSQVAKILVYGHSGSGKTCYACDTGLKTYVFDFDGKISSAASFLDAEKQALIDFDDYFKIPAPIEAFDKKMKELEKSCPYGVVVLDSATLFSDKLLNFTMSKNEGVKRAFAGVPAMQDYMIHSTFFKQLINRLLSLPCHVIVTGHINRLQDDSGAITNQVQLSGKLADYLPKVFTEVYHAHTKKDSSGKINHLAQTKSDGLYVCRTQIKNMPELIPLKFVADIYSGKKQLT